VPEGTFAGTIEKPVLVKEGQPIPEDTGDQGGGQNWRIRGTLKKIRSWRFSSKALANSRAFTDRAPTHRCSSRLSWSERLRHL